MLLARLQFNRSYSQHAGMLVLRDDGLALQRYRFGDSGTVLEDEWNFAGADVQTIHAYKVDAYVVDQLRLLFAGSGSELRCHGGNGWVCGAHGITAATLSGRSEAWMTTVGFPAFEQNWTTLWLREPEPKNLKNPLN